MGDQREADEGSAQIAVRRGGGRLDVLIDRAAKRNALSQGLLLRLSEVFDEFAADPDVKVAVLRGAGDRSFAAGGDLRELAALRTADAARGMSRQSRSALDAIRRFPVPVVAALNGDALGGGAELAIACDMRVAAAHVRLGFVQGRLAITTAWGGGADLQDLVGPAKALTLLARAELIAAPDALLLGLVDAVGDDLDAEIDRFLAPLLDKPRQVLAAYKAMRIAHRSGAGRDALETLETERFAEAWIHDDHWRAADAVLTRRAS